VGGTVISLDVLEGELLSFAVFPIAA